MDSFLLVIYSSHRRLFVELSKSNPVTRSSDIVNTVTSIIDITPSIKLEAVATWLCHNGSDVSSSVELQAVATWLYHKGLVEHVQAPGWEFL